MHIHHGAFAYSSCNINLYGLNVSEGESKRERDTHTEIENERDGKLMKKYGAGGQKRAMV